MSPQLLRLNQHGNAGSIACESAMIRATGITTGSRERSIGSRGNRSARRPKIEFPRCDKVE